MIRKALAAAFAAALLLLGRVAQSTPSPPPTPDTPACVDTDPLVVVGQTLLPAQHLCVPPPTPTAP